MRPNDPNMLGNLGISLAASGKNDEAIAAFQRAVELTPEDGGAERNLANALLDNRDFAGAALRQRAVMLRPTILSFTTCSASPWLRRQAR
jgi:Flp pilus assembly protein TadD